MTVDDDIEPCETRYQASQTTDDGWDMQIFTDEVFWMCPAEVDDGDLCRYRVVRFPFVPGYFMCKLVDHLVHYPVAGPFSTLKGAKAAVLVAGEQDDAEINTD